MIPATPVRRLTRARRRMRGWLLGIGAVIVVAVIVTAVLGGFANRTDTGIERVAAGGTIDTGEISVRLEGARIVTSGPAIAFPQDGVRWLEVDATLRNTTEDPVSSGTVSLRVEGAGVGFADAPREPVRLSDSAGAGLLQPDLPTRVAWVWRLEDSASSSGSGSLDTVVVARQRELGDPIFGDSGYGPLEGIARTTLRVEDDA